MHACPGSDNHKLIIDYVVSKMKGFNRPKEVKNIYLCTSLYSALDLEFLVEFNGVALNDFDNPKNDISSYGDLKEFLRHEIDFRLESHNPIEGQHHLIIDVLCPYQFRNIEEREKVLKDTIRLAGVTDQIGRGLTKPLLYVDG